jgi:hypothetical protein
MRKICKVDFASYEITGDNRGNANEEAESRATNTSIRADEMMRSLGEEADTLRLSESKPIVKGVSISVYFTQSDLIPRFFIRQLGRPF